MTGIRPVTAAFVVGTLVAVAVAGANPLVLVLTAIVLALLSGIAGGTRRACFVAAARLAGLVMIIWLILALIVDQSDSAGTVLLSLPSWQLGPGVSLGGTKTVTWMEQMLLTGAQAGLGVLGLGLLAQLCAARDWLDFVSAMLGRGTDLLSPLICLPEAAICTATVERAAIDVSPRIRRVFSRPTRIITASAELAMDWRLDHPRHRTSLGQLGAYCGLWLAAAVPVLALTGKIPLPVPSSFQVHPTIGAGSLLVMLLVASISIHLPSEWRQWRPRVSELPLVVAVFAVLAAWALRHHSGDDANLGLSPGIWPGVPPVLTICMGLLVVAAILTQTLEASRASSRGVVTRA